MHLPSLFLLMRLLLLSLLLPLVGKKAVLRPPLAGNRMFSGWHSRRDELLNVLFVLADLFW
jgi:hypothetical protein